jgi:hypothetical protein
MIANVNPASSSAPIAPSRPESTCVMTSRPGSLSHRISLRAGKRNEEREAGEA